MQTTTGILKHLLKVEENNTNCKLLSIYSPFSKQVAVETPLSIDTNILREFCKLLFTDDLNNIYQLTFNLVSSLGFNGEYIESLPPAEMYLYWALHLQKENQQKEAERPGTSSMFQGVPADI
jgi:hypothetical protein